MKNILLFVVCLFSKSILAQTLLVLQPDSTFGKDAFVWDYHPNTNYGDDDRLDITAWTANGAPYISRAYLQFDLSSIPSSAIIDSAFLSLYHNNTTQNYNGIHNGINDSYIQRITSAWQENLITWNNQPSTISTNQLFLSATTSGTQDFLNMNITNMIQDMVDYPTTSFGFMMRLQTEIQYRDLLFAACEHSDSTLHPKLEIYYNEPNGIHFQNENYFTVTLFPNPVTANSVLTIHDKNNSHEISIYNSIGKLVYQFKNFKEEPFLIGKLNFVSGIYFLQLKTLSGENRSLKFIVN